MQSYSDLIAIYAYWRRIERGTKKKNDMYSLNRCNRVGLFLALLIVSLAFYPTASADYFSAAPPRDNIASQTFVSAASTTPVTSFRVNVSEYDPCQMIKSITLDFTEPVAYVGFVIDLLREKPLIVNAPNTEPIVQYYDIRYLTGLADKIANVTIIFAIERAKLQNMTIAEDTLVHYQYNGTKFNECPLRKVEQDKNFVFFETETSTSSYFAITGGTSPNSWWSLLVLIAAMTLLTIIGAYLFRRFRINHPRNSVRT